MAKILQLLRNTQLYGSHEAALSAVQTKVATLSDGEPVLARYTSEDTKEHTILAIKSAAGYEIFDNAGSNEALIEAIERLDYTWEGVEKKPITSISETDGVIAPVQGSINAEFVDIADSGSVITATTVEGALQEIAAEIDGMDLSEVGGGDGDVLTTISETDGKVSATAASLSGIKLTGYTLDTDKTGAIAATDTVKDALSKLENKIADNTVSSTDKTITIDTEGATTDLAVNIDNTTLVKNATTGVIKADLTLTKLTSDEVNALQGSSNVKEAYKVIYSTDSNRTAIGDVVKIYKDSSLHSAYLGHVDDTITSATDPTVIDGTGSEALCFIYQKADGTYELVAVNVESFLQESEFSDGLQVVSNVVSVLKDATSGKVRIADTPTGVTPESAEDTGWVDVITVGTNGVKINNIAEAIAYATADLAVSAQGDNYITAAVDANNNKKINVTADVQSLTATAGTPGVYAADGSQTTAPTAGTLSGTANSLADGSDIATKVKTYVDGAIAIEAARGDAKNKADIAALDVTDTADAGQYVSAVSETDGKISVTRANVGEALITGFTTSTSTTGAIAATDSISNALNKLQNKADNGLDSVAAGNGISVSTKSSKSQTITAVAKSGDPIIEVTANGIATKENAIWDCGTYGDEPEP